MTSVWSSIFGRQEHPAAARAAQEREAKMREVQQRIERVLTEKMAEIERHDD